MQLVDLAGTDRSPLNINAHDSELVALTLNVQGRLLVNKECLAGVMLR